MKQEIKKEAHVLWDYLYLNEPIEPADVIVGLGCMDENIPKTCAKLYKQGYGKYLIFSGNVGKGTEGVLSTTEAEHFKQIAIREGVPAEKILTEPKATNTYENFYYTRLLIESLSLAHDRILVVQKPYVERRCRAIAGVEFPNTRVFVTSSKMTFDQFFDFYEEHPEVPQTDIVEELVGEITMIENTPKYGLQVPQAIPKSVKTSCKKLQDLGFHKYAMDDARIETTLNILKETVPDFIKQVKERQQQSRMGKKMHKIK